MQTPADAIAPGLEYLLTLAEAAREALPPPFRLPARAVRLVVEDLADPEILAALEIEDPFELSGLYDGIPLTEKRLSEPDPRPDQVFLFRRAILDEWIERGNVSLSELVTHVLIHELAHHFGWSDDDIAAIDPWWE